MSCFVYTFLEIMHHGFKLKLKSMLCCKKNVLDYYCMFCDGKRNSVKILARSSISPAFPMKVNIKLTASR